MTHSGIKIPTPAVAGELTCRAATPATTGTTCLGLYYAKAQMYDAENRRFAAVDPVKGRITEPMSMVQYLYVVDNPLRWVDLLGKMIVQDSIEDGGWSYTAEEVKIVQTGLKQLGYYSDSIDGVYTSNTQEAVYEFQKFYTDVPDTGKIDNITIQKIELVVNQMTALPSGNSPAATDDYYSQFNCSDIIKFDATVYEGFSAIKK